MKVYIHNNYATMAVDIYFTDEIGQKRYIAKPMKIVFEEFNPVECKLHEPSLRIDDEVSRDFLKAFAEALDGQDIKTDNDHKIKGLLEAKEAHLQDMRKLVFK